MAFDSVDPADTAVATNASRRRHRLHRRVLSLYVGSHLRSSVPALPKKGWSPHGTGDAVVEQRRTELEARTSPVAHAACAGPCARERFAAGRHGYGAWRTCRAWRTTPICCASWGCSGRAPRRRSPRARATIERTEACPKCAAPAAAAAARHGAPAGLEPHTRTGGLALAE